jgi:hypothetical protein
VENVPRSRNVVENKDSYASKAGMSLKRKGVGGQEEDSGFRSQNEELCFLPSAFRLLPTAYSDLRRPCRATDADDQTSCFLTSGMK